MPFVNKDAFERLIIENRILQTLKKLDPGIQQMQEEQAFNDVIEGILAGYPLCCIMDFASITYRFGFMEHAVVNQLRSTGYAGPINLNRLEMINEEVISDNNFVRCEKCSARGLRDHSKCRDCSKAGCTPDDNIDQDYLELLRWMVSA